MIKINDWWIDSKLWPYTVLHVDCIFVSVIWEQRVVLSYGVTYNLCPQIYGLEASS